MKKTQILTVVIHIIGWMLFLCIPVFFVSQNRMQDFQRLSLNILLFCLYYVAFFYANTEFFIPKLYLRRKQVIYFSLIAILLTVTVFAKPFDRLIATGGETSGQLNREFDRFGERPPPRDLPAFEPGSSSPRDLRDDRPRGAGGMLVDIISIVLFLLVWAVGYALQLVTLWKSTETRAVHAEAERARAELSFLKARINPHFLFNTLNNIYSMAMINHEQTAASVLKLSNIMRYITDDIVNDFVLLENEVQCIDNYISLQRLRLNKNTPVNYVLKGDPGGKMIAPLILMPFIENVFKYGVSNHQPSPINIKLEITEKSIYFYASNRIIPLQFSSERSGIGVSNTRQRLELLYPKRHLLLIKSTEEQFTVELTIYFEGAN